jgi:glutaminyl-tRNA synthetase
MPADNDAVVTVVHLGLDRFVEAAVAGGADGGLAVRRLANEVAADIGSLERLEVAAFVRLVEMEGKGELTTAQARTVLRDLLASGGHPEAIAAEHGFEAMAAGDLGAVVDGVIAGSPAEWARFVAGEDKLQGLFIGRIKAATQGRADLKAASGLLRERRAAG